MDVVAHTIRCGIILRALHNKGWNSHIAKIRSIVGEKRHAPEMLCDSRVGATKAACEFLG
jgi:hypothetical protein